VSTTGGKNRCQRPLSFDSGIVSIGDVSTRGFTPNSVFIGQNITSLDLSSGDLVLIGRNISMSAALPSFSVVGLGLDVSFGIGVSHVLAVDSTIGDAAQNCVSVAYSYLGSNQRDCFVACDSVVAEQTVSTQSNNVAISNSFVDDATVDGVAISDGMIGKRCDSIFSASNSRVSDDTSSIVAIGRGTTKNGSYDSVTLARGFVGHNQGRCFVACNSVLSDQSTPTSSEVIAIANSNVGDNNVKVVSLCSSVVNNDCFTVFSFYSGVQAGSSRIVSFASALGTSSSGVFAGLSGVGNNVTSTFAWNANVNDGVTEAVVMNGSLGSGGNYGIVVNGFIGANSPNCLVMANATIGDNCLANIVVGDGASAGDYVDNGVVLGRGALAPSGTVEAPLLNPIIVGYGASVSGTSGIAVGKSALSSGNYSQAYGQDAQAAQSHEVVFGALNGNGPAKINLFHAFNQSSSPTELFRFDSAAILNNGDSAMYLLYKDSSGTLRLSQVRVANGSGNLSVSPA